MGMMDYIIGKNVGREEARNSQDSGAAHRAEMDAIQARGTADQAQNTALAIAIALKQTREELEVTRKRFYRERQDRMAWRKAAEFRKLSLLKHGLTEEQIYAEQRELSADVGINTMTDKKILDETAKIDAEFENRSDIDGSHLQTNPMPN